MTIKAHFIAQSALVAGGVSDDQLHLLRPWADGVMTARVSNLSEQPRAVEKVVLYRWQHGLPADSEFYGEGFQMLSQTGGCLQQLSPIGRCDDGAVYRLYDVDREQRVYNFCVIRHAGGFVLLGFVSCHRFAGYFQIDSERIDVVMDLENVQLAPGLGVDLEGFSFLEGTDLDVLLRHFAGLISAQHPRQLPKVIPQGWCSWYHYYADVAASDVVENLNQLMAYESFEYIQLDDGYQAHMGDWLIPSDKFEGGVAPLIKQIRQAGKRAGIWVAPFIAQRESRLFIDHPDWFVKDCCGEPMAADTVTYGGWRCTPWFMLDGTHPQVIDYLKRVISTMRQEWGVDYFKLDANFWGACHGGRYFRRNATRIEAYREAMQAINEAANGAFILGCNAPMWASLGLLDGMRVSDDVERHQHRFVQLREEIFFRNWCHGRLWLNDPDCLVLRNIVGQAAGGADYRLHIATVVASGGILMLGDRLQDLEPEQRRLVQEISALLTKGYGAAKFDGFDHAIGIAANRGGRLISMTNPRAEPKEFCIALTENEQARVVVGEHATLTAGQLQLTLDGFDGAVVEVIKS